MKRTRTSATYVQPDRSLSPNTPLASFRRLVGREGLIIGLLVVVPSIVLCPLLGCDFINFDDPEYVTENPHVLAGLGKEGFFWAWTTVEASNWHPLTWLSLMLDAQLAGAQPWCYHLTSLLLHLANTVVLFIWLRGSTGAVVRSGLVALLFAVHPLHVESVAWVSERKDVLSTLFGLLALVAYTRYTRSPSLSRYLQVMGFLACSLLAKPMLVTLPFLFLVLDYWPLNRWPWSSRLASSRVAPPPGQPSARGLLLEKLPLLGLGLFSCAMTLWAQHRGGAVNSLKLTPLSERLGNSSLAYLQYLWQTFVPLNLAAYYPFPHGRTTIFLAVLAALALACFTLLAWRKRRDHPYLLVGWLWYLGTLVPMIGLVQVGGQARADRYTYFPLVGIFLLLVWGLTRLSRQASRERLAAWLAGAALASLMLLSWNQALVWRSSVTLWTHAIEATENNWMAYKNLNLAWAKLGKRDGAEPFLVSIIRRRPEDAGAHTALGEVLRDRGDVEGAQRHFQDAVRLDPGSTLAHYNLGEILLQKNRPAESVEHLRAFLQEDPKSPQGHNLLGLAQMEMGQLREATEQFELALELSRHPESFYFATSEVQAAPILYNLGRAFQEQGKGSQAATCFERAAALQPQNSRYHRALAFELERQGRHKEAQNEYREAMRLDPSWPMMYTRLAWLLATHPDARRRNAARSLQLALQASQATGDSEPRILDTLAAAYAESGRFKEAARTAQQAAERADRLGQRELAEQVRRRLGLYTRKECYRADPRNQ